MVFCYKTGYCENTLSKIEPWCKSIEWRRKLLWPLWFQKMHLMLFTQCSTGWDWPQHRPDTQMQSSTLHLSSLHYDISITVPWVLRCGILKKGESLTLTDNSQAIPTNCSLKVRRISSAKVKRTWHTIRLQAHKSSPSQVPVTQRFLFIRHNRDR